MACGVLFFIFGFAARYLEVFMNDYTTFASYNHANISLALQGGNWNIIDEDIYINVDLFHGWFLFAANQTEIGTVYITRNGPDYEIRQYG